MTTPASTLVIGQGPRIAYVLEIEGHNVVYTNVPDLTVWTGYTVRPGLQMHGSVSRRLDLLGFDLQPVGFQFELVDAIPWDTTNSIAKLMAHLDATALVTELTAPVDRDDTAISVRNSVPWPGTGTFYIGHERIDYSGKGIISPGNCFFSGLTRGQFPTSADSAASPGHWGHTHRVGTESGPEVSSRPRVWKNKMVTVYVVAWDPATGAWNTRADSLNELSGTIEDFGFKDGSWQFSCTTLEKRIDAPLLATQYQGYMSGLTLGSDAILLASARTVGTAPTLATVTVPAGTYTIQSLLTTLNHAISASFANHYIGLWLDGQYVHFNVFANAAGDYEAKLYGTNQYGKLVMRMLGWPDSGPFIYHHVAANGAFGVIAPAMAMVTLLSASQGAMTVTPTSGDWADQASDDMPSGGVGDGFLQIGDADFVWQVTRSGNAFSWIKALDLHGRPYQSNNLGEQFGSASEETVRYIGEDPTIPVKQVWIVQSTMSRLLLRMLLSTGTASYNHATYDVWPASMSCGFPANLVDIPSIEALSEQAGAAAQCFQVLLAPESMATHVESLMRQFGFHLIWRPVSGVYKLSATVPTTIANLTPTFTLDVSNTGNDHDTQTDSGAELVRNRLSLKYNRDPASGEFLGMDVYENLSAISEQDEPSALEYEALMLYDLDGTKLKAWRTNVAAPMCAYFARPIRKHTRSASRAAWFVSVGDVVLLEDPDMPDAVTGTYGTTSKAWVTAVTKNYETYEVESIELLIPPGRAYRYAPSAMLDYSRGDKGYDNATKRLYVKPSEFTRAADADDVTWFRVGDRIVVHPVDDNFTSWHRVVAVVGADYLEMTATLSAPAFDATKRYYVTLDDYDLAILNTARDREADGSAVVSFQADASNEDLVDDGGSGISAFMWGADLPLTDAGAAPTGDELLRNPSDFTTPSNALSVHILRDLAYAINNSYRHVTNQHPISEQYVSARTTASASYVQLAGPFKIWCPPGVQQLVFSIDILVSAGTGSVRVTCSPRRPTGASTTVLVFDNDVDQATVTTTSTLVIKVTVTVSVRPNQEGYTYVTLEFMDSAGTATVRAISAYFAARAVA